MRPFKPTAPESPRKRHAEMKRSLTTIVATGLIAALPLNASAQVSIGVGFGGPGWGVGIGYSNYAPPPLPVYSVPPAPYPNWQLVPGYWSWGSSGYYWVPAYWTAPPAVGYYWTPGYWGYSSGAYLWTPGYWGPTVGFYGGINYGFGYFGTGFAGGFWSGGVFNYNTAVLPVNRTVIHNVYNKTVINRNVCNRCTRVAYNGGRGGVHARPTAAQLAARRHGIAATAAQRAHVRAAAQNRALAARVNHGHPRLTAVRTPLTVAHHPSNAGHVAHGSVSAPAHHSTSMVAAHHHASMAAAPHHASMTTTHHSGTVASAHHNAPTTATHHQASMAAAPH